MVKVIAIFWSCMIFVLIFGLAQINFFHHLVLPKEILNRNTIESHWVITLPIHKQTDIYMVDTVKSYRQTQDIIEALNAAGMTDEVIFHLAGYGGDVEAVLRIIDAVKHTAADVTMLVEAPVYSGHAYLALSGNHLIIEDYGYLMLHNSSAMNIDCSTKSGVDRGMTNEQHCRAFIDAHMENMTKLILSLPIVTMEEKWSILGGQDLYLTKSQIEERQ